MLSLSRSNLELTTSNTLLKSCHERANLIRLLGVKLTNGGGGVAQSAISSNFVQKFIFNSYLSGKIFIRFKINIFNFYYKFSTKQYCDFYFFIVTIVPFLFFILSIML